MLKIIFFALAFHSIVTLASDFLTTPTGGDFSLETNDGPNFKLSHLKGKTVFLFFGFTRCPHVCPLTVQRLKMLSEHLAKNKISDAHFLFISVDNERDNKASLTAYAKRNGPLFSAGTASDEKLREIIALYGGHFTKIRTASKNLIIDHSSDVYVINPSGKWVDTIHFKSPFTQYLSAYEKSKKEISPALTMSARREMTKLGENTQCDLGKGNCEFKLPDSTNIKVQFSPFPIKTEKEINITVTSNTKKFTPREFDFVGVQQNMGLIRPALNKENENSYKTKIDLPLCEVSKMKWKVRLILEDSLSKLHYVEYFLETVDN